MSEPGTGGLAKNERVGGMGVGMEKDRGKKKCWVKSPILDMSTRWAALGEILQGV